MRLLHTTLFTLKSFITPYHVDGRGYAILSHTWGDDEVLFEDMATPDRRPIAHARKAWDKVQRACEVARELGFEFIWIDTLCIDKSSSAELSEAINSMFEWYALSRVCLAYLADYEDGGRLSGGDKNATNEFLSSRWFERGWTLQELIAPSDVVFYDAGWNQIGQRKSLAQPISEQTGIYRSILTRHLPWDAAPGASYLRVVRQVLMSISVAAKMSWVSQRQTTRPEDMAYCLLGLFDINMPLLYGEGDEKAFLRLQEEIVKHCFDSSILAWRMPQIGEGPGRAWDLASVGPGGRWDWILSPSPEYFACGSEIQNLRDEDGRERGSVHPGGLSMTVLLSPLGSLSKDTALCYTLARSEGIEQGSFEHDGKSKQVSAYLAILNCCADGNYTKRVALLLYKSPTQANTYFRARPDYFIVEMGDEHVMLGPTTNHPIDLSVATPVQLVLATIPMTTWQSQRGYCAYNWETHISDWDLVNVLECKYIRNRLLPPMPVWSKDHPHTHLTDMLWVAMNGYKINGVLLFERPFVDAFFVIWGTPPGDSADAWHPRRWWQRQAGYFCQVVGWSTVMGVYSREAVIRLSRQWHPLTGFQTFNEALLSFVKRDMALRSLSSEWKATWGPRGNEVVVTATVSRQQFLGVEGLVVAVTIGEKTTVTDVAAS
ncbi:heterokaryon incompatibility protein-domain-containing protein [Echria macrotheca]|uniref:Heterokaryon incompatibility protein-domain-containing protein n=1 Tax=Echria macrotheca TaxID=438768 RepID=A0AAJ0BA57_9PEZI|nr:heterokaryon incompatibility protein-domain-containing protein [Echria macrotheca]